MTVIEIKYAELEKGFAPALSKITIAGGSQHDHPIWRGLADAVRTKGRQEGWSFIVEGQPFSFDDQDAKELLLKLPRIPKSHKCDDADGMPFTLIGDAPRGR